MCPYEKGSKGDGNGAGVGEDGKCCLWMLVGAEDAVVVAVGRLGEGEGDDVVG